MQVSVLRRRARGFSQGAAILFVAGVAAGCSQQVSRFGGGVDDIFTASTDNQRQIIRGESQPYPGDVPAAAPVAAAPVNGSYSSSVSRGALAPVSTAPVSAARAETVAALPRTVAPDTKPFKTSSAPVPGPRELDDTATGTVTKPAIASGESDPAGWSRAGGTQVTVKEGETVYNLSRRFGVPAKVIMSVNGMEQADSLRVGQKIVIPTYVYSHKAPVSAPDNDPKTAAAKSSRGEKVPGESPAKPGETVAVLPNPPKLREGEADAKAAAIEGTKAKPPVADKSAKTAAAGSYVVQSGDTLSKIAKKHGVAANAIKQANGLDDGVIRIGQTLKIPAGGSAETVAAAKVKAVDPVTTATTKPEKAAEVVSYTPPKKTIDQVQDDESTAPNATGIGRMRWPVRGRVIANYGSNGGRKASDGIDIAVPEGTPVKAAENGVVIYAGDGLKEFGNTVLVRHENGLVTVYGHASELKVTRGEKVKRGQDIAVSGMSGSTDSPKLHFEVRKNSAPVDPSTYLE